jgi:hypothetical protein
MVIRGGGARVKEIRIWVFTVNENIVGYAGNHEKDSYHCFRGWELEFNYSCFHLPL